MVTQTTGLSLDPGHIVQTHGELFKPTLRPQPRPLNQNPGGGTQASLGSANEQPGSRPTGPDGGEDVGVEKAGRSPEHRKVNGTRGG